LRALISLLDISSNDLLGSHAPYSVYTPGIDCAAIKDEYEAVMTGVKIGIIVGSTRPGRHARAVADWVLGQTSGRPGAPYEIVDLADHPLPHLDEPMPPSYGQYQHDHTKAWAATIAGYDGFIFVTPEYNHSTSGVLKNAIDYVYAEWNNKAGLRRVRGWVRRRRTDAARNPVRSLPLPSSLDLFFLLPAAGR
jgi:NADPH-dependent FMN reductase